MMFCLLLLFVYGKPQINTARALTTFSVMQSQANRHKNKFCKQI